MYSSFLFTQEELQGYIIWRISSVQQSQLEVDHLKPNLRKWGQEVCACVLQTTKSKKPYSAVELYGSKN